METLYRGGLSLKARLRQLMVGGVLAASSLVMPSGGAAQQPFSLICMPDPQYYTNSNHPTLYNLYNRQATWIRDNAAAYNIKHVIWLGDLTNDNLAAQWTVADSAYDILDAANIPFAVVPGNHDYQVGGNWPGAHLRDLTRFNGIVGPSRFAGKSWYGGNRGNTTNRNENNYTLFSSGGLNFLVVGIEFAPRKEVLTWANNIISQHPNHRVIIFTHAFMTTNGDYTGDAGNAAGTVGADGADIFNQLARRHSNVFLVVCGHVTESVVNTKTGAAGNTIYEMLVDYQGEQVLGTGDNLGNGWLRILQFNPASNTISASTVTPAAGDTAIFTGGTPSFYNGPYPKSPTNAAHLFTLPYNMTAPLPPYTYLNPSVGFFDSAMNDDITGHQLDPDIAQDSVANWAGVWEDDHDQNGIFRIQLRGFDSDGNVRFARSVVNTSGANTVNCTNPAIAMAPDGRFVVVWQRDTTAINMRTYNANGTPVGTAEQNVTSVTVANASVRNPDVAIDAAGNFVVVWQDDADGNGTYQIRGRGFAHNYTPRFAEKTVNSFAAGQQQVPVIAMAANGDYVVAWEDNREGSWDIACRGFLANETERFPQFVDNATTPGQQRAPDVAMDNTGRFVVVWEDDADAANLYQVNARGFAANGSQLFSQRTVNVIAAGNQINPSVAMDSSSNWYAAWQDDGAVSGGEGYQMMTNKFNIAGTRLNAADIRANSVAQVTHTQGPPQRNTPVISAHASGRYLVAWADDMDGNADYQVLARGIIGTAKSLVVKSIEGTATRSPAQPFYAPNESVTLTAAPNPGYRFTGWSGAVTSAANPLTITMNTDKGLTANYASVSDVADWALY